MAASGSACSSNLRGTTRRTWWPPPSCGRSGPQRHLHRLDHLQPRKGNTEDEVRLALEALPPIVERLRAMSPTYLDYQKQMAQGG